MHQMTKSVTGSASSTAFASYLNEPPAMLAARLQLRA